MRESSSPLRKNKTGSTSIKSDVKQRLEEIRKQEEMNMKQKIQEFTEKEKRALERLQQKRSSMGEYIAERREIREQRFYNTKLNISLAEEEYVRL